MLNGSLTEREEVAKDLFVSSELHPGQANFLLVLRGGTLYSKPTQSRKMWVTKKKKKKRKETSYLQRNHPGFPLMTSLNIFKICPLQISHIHMDF